MDFKYVFRLITTPSCWARNYSTDKKWDKMLNEILDNIRSFKFVTEHSVVINGIRIWCGRYPYAFGWWYAISTHGLPSRKTVFRLYDVVKHFRYIQERPQKGKLTKKEAKSITIKVWSYLRDHPEIYSKSDLPLDLYTLICSMYGDCPLCEYFDEHGMFSGYNICRNCPLSKAGHWCGSEASYFNMWENAYLDDFKLRKRCAAGIVDIVKKW